MTPSTEFSLALACCRWNIFPGASAEIAALASRVQWSRFLPVVRRHRIQGLVARALHENDIVPPASEAAAISADATRIAEQNLRVASACSQLERGLADANVEHLFVKGLTLSALAYGDPFLKMGTDIDLLVDAHLVEKAATLLQDMGYALALPAVDAREPALAQWHRHHKESVWRKSPIWLDLHTRLSDNPTLIPAIGTSSPRQDVPIVPGLSLRTLKTDDLFAYLSVHGASSAWFRLKWVTDVAALVQRTNSARITQLYRYSQEQGAGRSAAQALLLADTLSLLGLPDALRTELKRDTLNRWLVSAALGQLFDLREPTRRPLGTASIHWSQLLLGKGWKFKLGEFARQVHGVVGGAR